MRWICLLLLCGCLEYEVVVETTVAEDGTFRRTVAIREHSDTPTTWVRYAPPEGPFRVRGDEANGFVAAWSGKPGAHASGLRVVLDDIDGDYAGSERLKGAEVVEGNFEIEVQDIIIGKLYRYAEVIDLGIDSLAFRREFDFALDFGLSVLIARLQRLEPDVDFEPVRKHAAKVLLPGIKRSLLVIHSEAVSLASGLGAVRGPRPFDIPENSHAYRAIVAELEHLGFRRTDEESGGSLPLDGWTLDDRLWNRLLEPLAGVTPEWKARLKERFLDENEDEDFADNVFEHVVPAAERDAVEARLRKFFRKGFGALFVNNLFDNHDIRVRVRMPGRLLTAEGALLHRLPELEWQRGGSNLLNPTFGALSFVPSGKMVGRIDRVSALLEYAELLRTASDVDREVIVKYLDIAREKGLAAAGERMQSMVDALKALKRTLAEK